MKSRCTAWLRVAGARPVWWLGKSLVWAGTRLGRAGGALMRLYFRMIERGLDLPPGSLRRHVHHRARSPPDNPDDWRRAAAELRRLFGCQGGRGPC